MNAALGPGATPIDRTTVADGLAVAGLRPTGGSLAIEFEYGGAAVQPATEPGSGFGPGDGVLAEHDLLADSRTFLARLRNARALAVREYPR